MTEHQYSSIGTERKEREVVCELTSTYSNFRFPVQVIHSLRKVRASPQVTHGDKNSFHHLLLLREGVTEQRMDGSHKNEWGHLYRQYWMSPLPGYMGTQRASSEAAPAHRVFHMWW